ncbi:hypothetical protein BTO32_14930 [Marinobacter lutaoensis]|uniref:HTH cro/C1-type domain-containing protein n=1 Tax=Marinobacter lutaoensis TaxID=135739 RepID=A0A1V2DPF2_9GAMM|nr:dynamin family protein [Marinobacter lutaoensis]ONF42505.1 hypothetical protein BTO32_14930 [Marinobacter lutaoensis]
MSSNESILKKMRLDAGISQAEMAAYLQVSQGQVSRFEQDPDEVSMKIYRQWEAYCGKVANSRPLDVGDPLKEIRQRIELIANYCDAAPKLVDGFPVEQLENGEETASTESLVQGIRRIARKPRMGLFGRFDMGKSRLANMLMGGDSLPASYQPATSIACLVRHIDDQPAWQPEPVWIFGKGFDLDRPDDEDHCKAHRIIGGGFEMLREYGTHSGSMSGRHEAVAAVVYVDSPFLRGCDIIDLPGYQHQEGDDQRAEMARQLADIIVYVSTAQGFMNEYDRSYLSQLIRNLPAYETPENGLDPLCNLFVVATRADIVGDAIDGILDKAASYSFDGISDTLQDRGEQVGVPIDEAAFRRRFFTYSAENVGLRSNFERELGNLLSDACPKHILRDMEKAIQQAKASGTQSLVALINILQETLDHQERAREDMETILSEEPQRIQKKTEYEQQVLNLIRQLKTESVSEIEQICDEWIDADRIESVIRNRYDKKKQARELAPGHIIEKIQFNTDQVLKAKAKRLSTVIDEYLNEYDIGIEANSTLHSSWEFNAKGAFIGSLASLGTFGALASWASVVAGGSNLGGYILAAKITSALAAIGIPTGGTGTIMTLIRTLGGPFAVGVGISVAIGVIAAAIFGDSWQRKLARKIEKELKKAGAKDTLVRNVGAFWDDTEKAFKHAAEETEQDFQRKLESLKQIAFSTDVDVLQAHLSNAKELKDFFAGIPWRPLES